MYLSLDEACTHVGATAFRLVAGIYNRQGSRLLGTAVSPPIRWGGVGLLLCAVLSNGVKQITLLLCWSLLKRGSSRLSTPTASSMHPPCSPHSIHPMP